MWPNLDGHGSSWTCTWTWRGGPAGRTEVVFQRSIMASRRSPSINRPTSPFVPAWSGGIPGSMAMRAGDMSIEVVFRWAYDDLVSSFGSLIGHVDGTWCLWLIRTGHVEVRWAGGRLRATPGQLVLIPAMLRRDQIFAARSRIMSVGFLLRRTDTVPLFAQAAPVCIAPPPGVESAMQRLVRAPKQDLGDAFAWQSAFAGVLEAWWSAVQLAGWRQSPGHPLDRRLSRIIDVLEKHGRIAPAPWDSLCEWTGLSRRQIDRLMADHTGMTTGEWLDRRTAERAATLLTDGKLAVKTVAKRLSFTDASHFVRWYRRLHGTTPGKVRDGV
jgi:AraC-like DNA-binding protein